MAEEAFRLLIADDEYWVRQAIVSLIDWPRHGFECLPPAEDGEDAWEKIQTFHPHIALLDINMPFLSGIELTKRIREQYPEVAVLILSGYSDFANVREAMLSGAIDYLLKPTTRDKLLAALSSATEHLLKQREERQRLDALRKKSELASSMLLDQELSEMLQESSKGKNEPSARCLTYDLRFSSYHLVQIRIFGLRFGAEEIRGLKREILEAFAAREKLAFHDVTRQGIFYLIAEMEQGPLLAACQELQRTLHKAGFATVSILVSGRKTSFRQLKSAHDELRQMQLVCPYSAESRVLSAGEHGEIPVQNRISPQQRRELEMAVKARSQAEFQRILYEEIGLRHCMDRGWRHVELLHTLSAIGHILRNALPQETTGSQAMGMDNLMELMLVAADRLDIQELFSILEEMIIEGFGAREEGFASEGTQQIIRQVREYIEQNYSDELSLSILARRFLVDDAHLSRTFKQVTGENLTFYIARTRIEKAREYIRQKKWTLTEIASMTGYDDYAYFNRVFRKITGKSPSSYKEDPIT